MKLAAQLATWLAVNMLLLVLLFVLMFGSRAIGWNMLLSQPVRDHLGATAQRVAQALAAESPARWPEMLAEQGTRQGMVITCCGMDRDIGPGGPPPDFDLRGDGHPPAFPQGLGPPPDERFQNDPPSAGAAGSPSAIWNDPPPMREQGPNDHLHGDHPPGDDGIRLLPLRRWGGYQVLVPAHIETTDGRRPVMIRFELHSAWALLRLLGVAQGLLFPLLAIVVSVLWWLPMIWRLTRGLRRVTLATQRIAEGRFDERVRMRGRDELAQLAGSVNRMAERLHGHIDAQKRFLSDAAHELTSPLARLQIAQGLLEPQLPPGARELWVDIQDDTRSMASLLHELLLFSRASLIDPAQALSSVSLRPLLEAALVQEARECPVAFESLGDWQVIAEPALLRRAVANLLRNAVRYAGAAGGIALIVSDREGKVAIAVTDRGPGVPPESLARLGEPFYRPEAARSRDTGGFGLGLAIVRRCVDACGGSLVLRNRAGGGFEAEISLRRA